MNVFWTTWWPWIFTGCVVALILMFVVFVIFVVLVRSADNVYDDAHDQPGRYGE